MNEKITLTLKRETLEQLIAIQRRSVEIVSQAAASNEWDGDDAAEVCAAQRFFIGFLERHLTAASVPAEAPPSPQAPRRAKYDPADNAERKAAQNAAVALCEVCGVEVPAPVAAAARQQWQTVLCLAHGRERRVADKEAPAQMQGL